MWLANLIPYDTLDTLLIAVLLLGGLILLTLGGHYLTNGAASLALILNISPVIVGLTVVAMATSAPELLTSLFAASSGNGGLAIGNILGSNICNIGLILGVAALIRPLGIQRRVNRLEAPLLVVLTLLFSFLCWEGLVRWEGVLLLFFFLLYNIWLIGNRKQDDLASGDETFESKLAQKGNLLACSAFILLGGILLAAGADVLVNSSVELATRLGVSDALIGITLVAFGTSVPELAATIAAAAKKQGDIVIGNIIGSNLFNMLLVGGATAAVFPFSIPHTLFSLEIPGMLLITFALLAFFYTESRLSRWEGAFFLALYAAILFLSVITESPAVDI